MFFSFIIDLFGIFVFGVGIWWWWWFVIGFVFIIVNVVVKGIWVVVYVVVILVIFIVVVVVLVVYLMVVELFEMVVVWGVVGWNEIFIGGVGIVVVDVLGVVKMWVVVWLLSICIVDGGVGVEVVVYYYVDVVGVGWYVVVMEIEVSIYFVCGLLVFYVWWCWNMDCVCFYCVCFELIWYFVFEFFLKLMELRVV